MDALQKESDTSIVIDCPICHRTIWNGTRCHHGLIALEKSKDAPREEARKRSGGLRRSSNEDQHGIGVE